MVEGFIFCLEAKEFRPKEGQKGQEGRQGQEVECGQGALKRLCHGDNLAEVGRELVGARDVCQSLNKSGSARCLLIPR